MIKAMFFDVDGTLYTHRIHDFPQSTKDTLYKLKENGYKIGIATSRCRYEVSSLPKFFREFPFDAKIFDGGALVMSQNEILEESPIDQEDLRKLIQYTKLNNIPLRYSTFDNDYIAHCATVDVLDQFFKLYLNMPNVKPYEGEKVYNIIVYTNKLEQSDEIQNLLTNSSIIAHTPYALEITAKGIEKSKGIEHLCNRWNITLDEIACFGDGANDAQMLKNAGLGVAMGNAFKPAKDAADKICGNIDEDGIYHFCKEQKFI